MGARAWPLPAPSTPGGRATTVAAFSGTDFHTYACVSAVVGRGGQMWSRRVPGPTDNRQEQGPAAAVSHDGAVHASVCTHAAGEPSPTVPGMFAALAVLDPRSGETLLTDRWPNGTAAQVVHVGTNGNGLRTVFMAVAANSTGGGPSLGRVYSFRSAATKDAATATLVFGGHLQASCMSPSGSHLVVATVYQSVRLLAYRLDGAVATLTANSSLPAFPAAGGRGLYTYGATCRVGDAGIAIVTFPLFAGVATVTQSAVAAFVLPPTGALPQDRAPARASHRVEPSGSVQTELRPLWMWLSDPVAPMLQDMPSADVMSADGRFYAYASWGGVAAHRPGASSATPPTVRVFQLVRNSSTPLANTGATATRTESPLVELQTPSPYRATTPTGGNFSMSASITALDLQVDHESGAVFVLAVGPDAHMNLGSSGGTRYLWRVDANAYARGRRAPWSVP